VHFSLISPIRCSICSLIIAFFIFVIFTTQQRAFASQVAIVIDDMGYRYSDRQALALPGNVTYAFLPQTTYAKALAVRANNNNHDVLIHIPMESQRRNRLGPGALTSSMNEQAFKQSLAKSFAEFPFAVGINNHMGSYLTELYKPMSWTMDFLQKNNLLFLDSKTSPHSKAKQAALDYGVPIKTRHVFLDNQLNKSYIQKQFNQLMNVSKKNHNAIGIAHPHPETVAVLMTLIPTLKEHGIDLVPLSTLYPTKKMADLKLTAN
jgi:hypothetical protein